MFLNDVRFVQNLKKTFKLFKQFKGKAANLHKLESYFINFYILCAEKTSKCVESEPSSCVY